MTKNTITATDPIGPDIVVNYKADHLTGLNRRMDATGSGSGAVPFADLIPNRSKRLFHKEDVTMHRAGDLYGMNSRIPECRTPFMNLGNVSFRKEDQGIFRVVFCIPDRKLH